MILLFLAPPVEQKKKSQRYIILMKVLIAARTCKQTHLRWQKSENRHTEKRQFSSTTCVISCFSFLFSPWLCSNAFNSAHQPRSFLLEHANLLSALSDPGLSLLALLLQGVGHDTREQVSGQLSESGAHGTRLPLKQSRRQIRGRSKKVSKELSA